MVIDLRASPERLAGEGARSAAAVVESLMREVGEGSIDTSRARVVCDWIQYRKNFREPVELRAIGGARAIESVEVAVDLRRAAGPDACLEKALRGLSPGNEADGRFYLEDWSWGTESCIWKFNSLYWSALGLWEESTGRGYEQALPGGQSDATNVDATYHLAHELLSIWDELAARQLLPSELQVLELGVGNGRQAQVFLDELARLDAERGSDHYRHLNYLMADYSPHVLRIARKQVAAHADHVSTIALDATRPMETLNFLREKVFFVYISNVYDNLPTEEVALLRNRLYRVQVRAYIPAGPAIELAGSSGLEPRQLASVVSRLLRLGPELLSESDSSHFPDPLAATALWRKVWDALRLEERYVPLEGIDAFEVADGVFGELLRPALEECGDVRMHLSNGAVASFSDTLPLLHPMGFLHCHDLFVTEGTQYLRGFRGPGKYEGSVVNWVNGPFLAAIGANLGCKVTFRPFVHREASNVVTLVANLED